MSALWLVGPDGREQLRIANGVGAVGIELALAPFVGWLLGQWLDGVFGIGPTLSFVGLGAGLLAGFRALYRVFLRARRELEADSSHAEPRAMTDA